MFHVSRGAWFLEEEEGRGFGTAAVAGEVRQKGKTHF